MTRRVSGAAREWPRSVMVAMRAGSGSGSRAGVDRALFRRRRRIRDHASPRRSRAQATEAVAYVFDVAAAQDRHLERGSGSAAIEQPPRALVNHGVFRALDDRRDRAVKVGRQEERLAVMRRSHFWLGAFSRYSVRVG